jgi:hypothetical protein
MKPTALVLDLEARGVVLAAAGGSLKMTAPAGVLDAPTLETLKALKPSILAMLTRRPAHRWLDPWRRILAAAAADELPRGPCPGVPDGASPSETILDVARELVTLFYRRPTVPPPDRYLSHRDIAFPKLIV